MKVQAPNANGIPLFVLRPDYYKGACPAVPATPSSEETIRYLAMLLPLDQADPRDVELLLDAAFGTDRHHRTAYKLRAGMSAIPSLSLAALDDAGRLIGSLQSWPVQLVTPDAVDLPLVLVGPVAVNPALQRLGLGREMMARVLAQADADGAAPQVLIGDPEYYGRFFGFSAEQTGGWELPGPFEQRRLLARTGGRALPAKGMLGPRA
jgi:predicted N-acetyltransferase YhbS